MALSELQSTTTRDAQTQAGVDSREAINSSPDMHADEPLSSREQQPNERTSSSAIAPIPAFAQPESLSLRQLDELQRQNSELHSRLSASDRLRTQSEARVAELQLLWGRDSQAKSDLAARIQALESERAQLQRRLDDALQQSHAQRDDDDEHLVRSRGNQRSFISHDAETRLARLERELRDARSDLADSTSREEELLRQLHASRLQSALTASTTASARTHADHGRAPIDDRTEALLRDVEHERRMREDAQRALSHTQAELTSAHARTASLQQVKSDLSRQVSMSQRAAPPVLPQRPQSYHQIDRGHERVVDELLRELEYAKSSKSSSSVVNSSVRFEGSTSTPARSQRRGADATMKSGDLQP
jgi:hypothetical protein